MKKRRKRQLTKVFCFLFQKTLVHDAGRRDGPARSTGCTQRVILKAWANRARGHQHGQEVNVHVKIGDHREDVAESIL